MEASLANLRQWIDQSPHLKNIRQDDQVLQQLFNENRLELENSKVSMLFIKFHIYHVYAW